MSFLTGTFLFAMIAAAGPLIIHLLNRRRHRVVHWAAMDFLREAVRRNKRIIELKDIVLLVLRTLAVALFVMAMAQPYVQSQSIWWIAIAGFAAVLVGVGVMIYGATAQRKGGIITGATLLLFGLLAFAWTFMQKDEEGTATYTGGPVHAVIVIDNSLSMGYVELDKSLLDVAKARVKTFIETLPKGSDISLIPLCNQEDWHLRTVDATQEDALDTLESIELVDRAGRAAEGAESAREALKLASHLPTKRVIFVSDLQRDTWSPDSVQESFKELGAVQIVQVNPSRQRSNSWVADFRLRDGVADAEAPAVFTGTVRYLGEEPRPRARVTLKINDTVVEEQYTDLVHGSSQLLTFKYKFESAGSSTEPLFLRARIEIDSKEPLMQDNFREIVVPVVAEVPVVFIDQLGSREQPKQGKYGETFLLRRMMTHRTPQQSAADKPLIDIRHRSSDLVTREDLEDARLVVLAGVSSPSEDLVQLLREYVEQGGHLFLAAGGEFDPGAWTEAAWRRGAGILPAPLKSEPIGRVPTTGAASGQDFPTFGLDVNSMRGEAGDLQLEPADLKDLLSSPFFYKAVAVDQAALADFSTVEKARLEERRKLLAEYETNEREWSKLQQQGQLTSEAAAARERARAATALLSPSWLTWSNALSIDDANRTVDEMVARTRPRVMGSYQNGEIFAIRRDIGKGRVVMLTTGVFPAWNNMASDDSVLLLDHLLLSLLTRSLPSRTFDAVSQIDVPVEARDQAARFEIAMPGRKDALPVRVDPLAENVYGLRLRNLAARGTYELRRVGRPDEPAATREWKMMLAVNGPSEESDLNSFDQKEFIDRVGLTRARWVGLEDEITLEGDATMGHNLWKLLMWGVLICLAVEMAFLAWPHLKERQAAATPAEAS